MKKIFREKESKNRIKKEYSKKRKNSKKMKEKIE